MIKQKVHSSSAPQAIGPYSQAIRSGNTIYLSGQIPLDPVNMTIIQGDFAAHVEQVFINLRAVCRAAGGDLEHIVKLTIYLTDLTSFSIVNDTMTKFFVEPYPARSTIQVSALPKAVNIEIDAVMVL